MSFRAQRGIFLLSECAATDYVALRTRRAILSPRKHCASSPKPISRLWLGLCKTRVVRFLGFLRETCTCAGLIFLRRRAVLAGAGENLSSAWSGLGCQRAGERV